MEIEEEAESASESESESENESESDLETDKADTPETVHRETIKQEKKAKKQH